MVGADIIAVVTTAAAVAVAVVALIAFFYERKKFRLAALMEALRVLGDIRHREARKILYGNANNSSYEILGIAGHTSETGAGYEDLFGLAKDIVRSDYNHIGTLIRHKLLDEKIIISEHNWIIQKVWELTQDEIMNRRKTIGPSNYMENLEQLKYKAKKYEKDHLDKKAGHPTR